MNIKYLFIVTFLFFSANSFGQHLELMDDKGEVGLMMGYGSYNGDIAPDVQFIKMNYGAYYKKQINEFVGIRLNYQSLDLNVNDNKSSNAYAIARGYYFERNFHELTLMTELYFNRFISGRKNYRFSPYLGFGAGLLISGNIDKSSNGSSASNQYPVIPINLGIKYSISNHINLFAEYKKSYSTSDYIDHLADDGLFKNVNGDLFQGSKSGKDNLISAQIGLSYNFRKIYGPDPIKTPKHKNTGTNMESNSKLWSKFNIFKLFKRK